MIHIENETQFHKQPRYRHSRKAEHQLVWRTLTNMPPEWTSQQLADKINEKWGSKISTQHVGSILKELYTRGYVHREPHPVKTWYRNYYNVTELYRNEWTRSNDREN